MGLIDRAKKDTERFTSDKNGFGVDITFTAPTGEIVSVVGLAKKHHLGIDPNLGTPTNSKTASVSVSEKFLTDATYPVRNDGGIVSLKGHLVDVVDSTGNSEKYIIEQWFPDETIGFIVCILGTYKSA
jgi:hypothetical protein